MRDHIDKKYSADPHRVRSGGASGSTSQEPPLAGPYGPLPLMRKSSCACGGGCPACQGSAHGMKISEPNDAAELEADRIAETVMRMPVGEAVGSSVRPASTHQHVEADDVNRKCNACEDEELEEPVMRKEASVSAEPPPESPPAPPPSISSVVGSGGLPLDNATRGFFEPRFGIDLGHVRVHSGADASMSARSINARAYTLGSNIVFGGGEYSPATDSGRHLLAHELAHVAQQPDTTAFRSVDARPRSRVGSETIYRTPGDLDDVFESPSGDGDTSAAGGGSTDTGCPRVPTKLGDVEPEPSCPTATHIGTNEVARFNFCLDSDKLISPGDVAQLDALVSGNHPKTRFLVHGYASPEGKVKYNFNLACHRANHIAEEMHGPIRKQVESRLKSQVPNADQQRIDLETGTEIQSRIETAAQGPTSNFGSAEANRLVIVYAQVPRAVADEEPSCEDAHGKIGNIKPEAPLDSATVDLTEISTGRHLTHFHFCEDSDVLAATKPVDLIMNFAREQAAKSTFVVHGFSSEEGDAEYNRRLSAHRALRVARELINAGVRSEQIREVSALGETTKFGEREFNRIAIVHAEGGEIDELETGPRAAETGKQKEAIVKEAKERILAGQYKLEADAYISFWTCGRTRTLKEAVERLTIEVPDNNDTEFQTKQANGVEESDRVNVVKLSNVALKSTNAIECVMGRLIDMSYHQAELGNPDLNSGSVLRHKTGLHLIHLAGLEKCTGDNTESKIDKTKNVKRGIDPPETNDPRQDKSVTPPPPCAEAPQPTRLHFPVEGAKDRELPNIEMSKSEYLPATGKLTTNFDPKAAKASGSRLLIRPEKDMLTAKAEVKFSGDPATFADYEVGFVQSVIADESETEYGSGHKTIHQIPVPIRNAHLRGDVPVPAPWTTLDSMNVPGPDGTVPPLSTTGIALNGEAAIFLSEFDPRLGAAIAGYEQDTRIAIWLIARRRGAPLDRFSIRIIDGVMYDLIQTLHIEHRHVIGTMSGPGPGGRTTIDPALGGEGEVTTFVGGFHTSKPTELPADPSAMRLTGAVASDIQLRNKFKRIIEPEPTDEKAMGQKELDTIVADILDNLEVFDSVDDAINKTGGKKMPRLGFDFVDLTITLPFNIKTGRLRVSSGNKTFVKAEGTGLGNMAAAHIAKAVDLRIHDRSTQGQDVVVRRDILKPDPDPDPPSDKTHPLATVKLAPLPRNPNAPPAQESDLLKRLDVITDMAEAWACTELTMTEPFEGREFARSYSMDRNKEFHPIPTDRLTMGEPEAPDGSFTTNLPCAADPDGVNLGSFHTHPEPDPIPPEPSEEDTKYYTEKCPAGQHFIVTDNRVFRVSPDGKSTSEVRKLPKAPGCRKINLEGRKKRKKIGDDF